MKRYETPRLLITCICAKDVLTDSVQADELLPTYGKKELIIEDIW